MRQCLHRFRTNGTNLLFQNELFIYVSAGLALFQNSGMDFYTMGIFVDRLNHWLQKWNVKIVASLEIVFACENEPWKQQWLISAYNPDVIFTDVQQLAAGHGINAVNGQDCEVALCDFLFGGFSCRSMSLLNNARSLHGNAVQTGTGTTGETLPGTRRSENGSACLCDACFLSERDRDSAGAKNTESGAEF